MSEGLLAYLKNNKQGLMALASGMLQASGPSPTPVGFGQAFGAGLANMQQQQMMQQRLQAQNGSPSAVREYEYYNRLDDAGKAEFLRVKRAQQFLDVGGGFMPVGPTGVGNNPMIPKTPTPKEARELQDTAAKERSMALSALRENAQTVGKVDEVLQNPEGLKGITGWRSAFPNIPGGKAADAQADLDTIKSRSAFGALQEMRANSPTGGALGAVAVQELQMLRDAEASLQNAQSEGEFKKALGDYKTALSLANRAVKDTYRTRYNEDLPDDAPITPSAPQTGGIKFLGFE